MIAAGAAVALLVVTFLDWYEVTDGAFFGPQTSEGLSGLSAWQAFGIIDLLLALVILLGLALLAFQLVGRGPTLPVALGVVTSTLALVAALLVAYRILNQPGSNDAIDVGIGAWLGLAATAAIFWGAWKALSDERPRPSDPPAPAPERRSAPA
jgi:hypothetical protein